MSATSFLWFAWMGGTTAVYWLSPPRFRDLSLIAVTVIFLFTYSAESAAILLVFTGITYFASGTGRLSTPRLVAIATVIVGVLVFYKLRVASLHGIDLQSLVIPLGLSYYSFRCLHYLIERYKGMIRDHSFRSFSAYLLFLPTLMVGPIHRFPQFQRDANRIRWDAMMFSEGLLRILYGYFKIMVLAVFLVSEEFGQYVETISDTQIWWSTYLFVIERAFYAYLLFAGYCDIAIGFGLLLGYRVMENFDWPFIRKNISDFWRSWHISLSSWVREYAYMTIVATTRRTVLAALVSMVIFGLWHEISLRYVAWGLYHGAGIAIWQNFQKWKFDVPVPRGGIWTYVWHALSILLTFNFVILSFVLILEPDLSAAMRVYSILFGVT
jgi:alginate O-acetyltransferase complex protein AlgI